MPGGGGGSCHPCPFSYRGVTLVPSRDPQSNTPTPPGALPGAPRALLPPRATQDGGVPVPGGSRGAGSARGREGEAAPGPAGMNRRDRAGFATRSAPQPAVPPGTPILQNPTRAPSSPTSVCVAGGIRSHLSICPWVRSWGACVLFHFPPSIGRGEGESLPLQILPPSAPTRQGRAGDTESLELRERGGEAQPGDGVSGLMWVSGDLSKTHSVWGAPICCRAPSELEGSLFQLPA